MAVQIISARHDENGNLHGGQAGNQTGHEVDKQNWYLHKKGWTVIRIKDEKKRKKVAEAARKAYANKSIGYDQYQRTTLYNNVKPNGFDPSKTTKAVETDCSALVRTCCAYAGVMADDFYTGNEVSKLKATGEVEVFTSDKYCKSSDYLLEGDILVTKTKGHTVMVINDGAKVKKEETKDDTVIAVDSINTESIGKVTSDGLNIRSDAGTENKIVGSLKKDDYVYITKEKDGWGYVNNKGWASLKFISKYPVKTKDKATTGTVTAKLLNTRKAPVNGEVKKIIKKDEKVKITKTFTADGDWGYDTNNKAWVSLKYIKF